MRNLLQRLEFAALPRSREIVIQTPHAVPADRERYGVQRFVPTSTSRANSRMTSLPPGATGEWFFGRGYALLNAPGIHPLISAENVAMHRPLNVASLCNLLAALLPCCGRLRLMVIVNASLFNVVDAMIVRETFWRHLDDETKTLDFGSVSLRVVGPIGRR